MKTASRDRNRRRRLVIAQSCAVLLLAGCGHSTSPPSSPATTVVTPPTAGSSPAVPPTPASAAGELDSVTLSIRTRTGTRTVTSAAGAGDHLQLQVGDQLQIIFHSTYWTAPSNSDPTVLAPVGEPVVAGRLSGCVAGMGCGTVTITFAARATGTSIIEAHRDTCGEALACSGTRGDYQLTVTSS